MQSYYLVYSIFVCINMYKILNATILVLTNFWLNKKNDILILFKSISKTLFFILSVLEIFLVKKIAFLRIIRKILFFYILGQTTIYMFKVFFRKYLYGLKKFLR